MTPDQHIKSLDKTIRDLQGQYNAEIMVKVGTTALTLIKERVQETGTDAKGGKYRPYSTAAMLVGCKSMNKAVCNTFFGKEKNKKLEWRTIKGRHLAILPGGYKQLRNMHGRQTDHVDFMFSGRMWSNINIISKVSDHQRGTVIIGAKTADDKKKLEGNTKKRGDILDLSQNEQKELITQYNLQALQVFKNNGL